MKFLSLPDETISVIFYHLRTFDTTGTFNYPRHGFALALTNTRLLRLFCVQITHITPQITNESPPTLSPRHILSVIRLVGCNLRELHLPKSAHKILPQVYSLCCRLEKLGFNDLFENIPSTIINKLLGLPSRALSIQHPSRVTLQTIRGLPPPEELCLTKISISVINEVILLLRNPPKKLQLQIEGEVYEPSPALISCLEAACPQMKEVSVGVHTPFHIPFDLIDNARNPLMIEAVRILEQPRLNGESKCLKMALEGNFMKLIRHANPKATLEVTRGATTIIRDECGIFLKSIHIGYFGDPLLTQQFMLTQDLSRLKKVLLGNGVASQWFNLLPPLQLERVSIVEHPSTDIGNCRLCANTVSIQARLLDGRTSWSWISDAKRIEVINCRSFHATRTQRYRQWVETISHFHFFKSLHSLLCQFNGSELWMDSCGTLRPQGNSRFMLSLLRKVRRAIDEFEAHGGDAGTVRAQLNCIDWYNGLAEL